MSSTSLLIVICCFAPLGVCVGQVNHFHLHRRPDTTAMAASSCRTCALAGPSCIWAVCSGTLSLFVVEILLPWFGWCGSFTIPPPLPSTISILVLYSPWQPLHSGCSAIHLRCWYDLVVAAHRYRIMIYSYDFYPSSFFLYRWCLREYCFSFLLRLACSFLATDSKSTGNEGACWRSFGEFIDD